ALIAHRGAGPDAGCALDRGGVDAAVHDAPRGVVLRAEQQVPGDPGPGDLVEGQAGDAQEVAGSVQGTRGPARGGRGPPGRLRGALRIHGRWLPLAGNT